MRKRIFAKYKTLNRNNFKKDLKKKADFFKMSTDKYLDWTIQGIHGDILDSTEIIAREKQRVGKAKKAISVVLSVMTEPMSDRAKRISEQYYEDLLQSKVSDLLLRVKN